MEKKSLALTEKTGRGLYGVCRGTELAREAVRQRCYVRFLLAMVTLQARNAQGAPGDGRRFGGDVRADQSGKGGKGTFAPAVDNGS